MKMILSRTKNKINKEVNAISSVVSYFAAWMQMYIMVRRATREWRSKQQKIMELRLNQQHQRIMKINKQVKTELIN